jgi:hypothetical protein
MSDPTTQKGIHQMKYALSFLVAFVFAPPAFASANDGVYRPNVSFQQRFNDRVLLAQADTKMTTQTSTPTAPASVTTTVKGGSLAADVLQWLQVALVPILGGAIVALILKGMALLGIQTTAQQSDQLAKIALNGINDAMSKAETGLRTTTALDINLKGQIMADAVAYTQEHAKETLSAMGLDPKSGKATEAIRAKILTAINDPKIPTPAAITPPEGQAAPMLHGVAIEGKMV